MLVAPYPFRCPGWASAECLMAERALLFGYWAPKEIRFNIEIKDMLWITFSKSLGNP